MFARGHLDPLLCRHHTTKHPGQTHWSPYFGTFFHDLVELSVGILGNASRGSHQAKVIDLMGTLNSEELPQLAPSAEVCSVGPATGLARTSHCLSAVSTFPSSLLLQRLVADSLFFAETGVYWSWYEDLLSQHERLQASPARSGCATLASALPSQSLSWKSGFVQSCAL